MNIVQRACGTKKRHPTREEALQHKAQVEGKHTHHTTEHHILNVYACVFCGFWHVGHTDIELMYA